MLARGRHLPSTPTSLERHLPRCEIERILGEKAWRRKDRHPGQVSLALPDLASGHDAKADRAAVIGEDCDERNVLGRMIPDQDVTALDHRGGQPDRKSSDTTIEEELFLLPISCIGAASVSRAA